MKRKTDYTATAVAAAKSVLIELIHLLREYENEVVVVGGWVPELLLEGRSEPHVGTLDVDLALDHRTLTDAGYRTIHRLLVGRGYEQDARQAFIYFRKVEVDDREVVVEVDLLAGEYGGTGKSHRTQRIQDIRPRKARGCDLAFELNTQVTVQVELPGGGRDEVQVRVASIVPFLIMKGMALADRLSEKDAWDVYYCLKNYPGGPEALVAEFRPHLTQKLVQEGLAKIRAKFSTVQDMGPTFVADFEGVTDPLERDRIQRDAFERVQYLLEKLGIV